MSYNINPATDKSNFKGIYRDLLDYQGQNYISETTEQHNIQGQIIRERNEPHPNMYQRGINQNINTEYYNFPNRMVNEMPVSIEDCNYRGGSFNNMPTNFQQNYTFSTAPVMADVAMMYGSRIMDSGKEIVDKEINKYVSVTKIKYYFSVDTAYVLKKLTLLLFPFTNLNWTPKVSGGKLAEPRDDLNAPDLYIPLMAYITFILLAGVVMGTKSAFSPETLCMLASQSFAFILIELALQTINIYITNLQKQFSTWDLIAYPGYKFIGIIITMLLDLAFNRVGYFFGLAYCSLCMSFFLVRSLKWRMMMADTSNNDLQGNIYAGQMYQRKRGLFFLFSIALSQPLVMWWLSANLQNNK